MLYQQCHNYILARQNQNLELLKEIGAYFKMKNEVFLETLLYLRADMEIK